MSPSPSEVRFSIRLADLAEVPRIQQIGIDADTRFAELGHPELADGSTIPTTVAERAIGAASLHVADVDGKAVGWVYTARLGGELCVGHICVAPEFGRRGIGSALLGYVVERARAAGERSIVLNTQTDVEWGQRWYERHRFAVVPPESWSPALATVTAAQTTAGLDWSTRVHMRLRFDGPDFSMP